MQPYNKYSNTCEEGEAQFRISVWHLLMNLKKTTIKKTVEMDQKKKERKAPGDIIILQLCTKNLDDMIYSSWDIECEWLKLVIMNYFLPSTAKKPPPKNQNFEKMRKLAGDIILYMCTKNHNHTRHRSWDMEWDRQNILLFWAIFCRFTSLLTPKIKIGKKIKTTTTGDIIFLHVCTINENHMYNSWDIRCDEQNFLPFWAIFCPLTLLTIQHIKILKKWEKCLKISSFYT